MIGLACLLAFLVGAVAEYFAERWGLQHTALVAAYKKGVEQGVMTARVRRIQRLGAALLLLGVVDLGSVFGGVWLFVAVHLGSQVGAWLAAEDESWERWSTRNNTERPATWWSRLRWWSRASIPDPDVGDDE